MESTVEALTSLIEQIEAGGVDQSFAEYLHGLRLELQQSEYELGMDVAYCRYQKWNATGLP